MSPVRKIYIKTTKDSILYPTRNAKIKQTYDVGRDAEKLEQPLYIAIGNVKWCSYFGNSLVVSQETKQSHHMTQFCFRSIPRKIENICSQKLEHECPLAALLLIAPKAEDNSTVCQLMNG